MIALVGCSRFDADLDFRPPPGWIHIPLATAGDVWVKGGGSHEKIMTKTSDTPLPRSRGQYRENIKICKGHPAVFIEVANYNELWEGVSTTWGTERHMAVYTRPISSLIPDPQAEAAIRTLCPKKP